MLNNGRFWVFVGVDILQNFSSEGEDWCWTSPDMLVTYRINSLELISGQIVFMLKIFHLNENLQGEKVCITEHSLLQTILTSLDLIRKNAK